MTTATRQPTLLRSERIAGGILPRVLSSFDMIAIFVAIVLWIGNAGVVTGAGSAAYIYWVLGFITFLIPGAIVTGQLGLMFPGEGSIYVWTTKALGDFMGFLAGFCAWWPGVLVLIAAADTIVLLIQEFGRLFHMALLQDPGTQGLVIILIITFSFLLSILRFRVTQNFVNSIFVIYGAAILLIGVAGLFWLITGHQAVNDLSWKSEQWLPSTSNMTFYGLVVLALLGIEVPLNMGVEIKDIRSITRYLLWGSIVVMVAYLIATFGVMSNIPLDKQGDVSCIVEAVRHGFGAAGQPLAVLVNLILIGFFLLVTVVYNYSFARLIFVSGLDRRLPAVMSKINANKVPWIAVLLQSVIASFFAAIIFLILPALMNNQVEGISDIVYNLIQAAVTIIWCVSMAILFVDVMVIRYKFRELFAFTRLAPDGIFFLCSTIGTFASIVGVIVIFTKPWTKLVTTWQWDAFILAIVAISFLVAVIVYVVGRKTIRHSMSDEEIIAEITR